MSRDFIYEELDIEGKETLESIALANLFNEWMYQTILPHCKGKILEIGSGIGNISEFFLKDKANLVMSDIRENYCSLLREKFSSINQVEITKIDLVREQFEQEYKAYLGQFDTVFALNVVEHIKDDQLALENIHSLLKPEGNVIILVPAYQTLYNQFDESLGHYRRYTSKSLSKLVSHKFDLIHNQYFNLAGILGWIVSGKILKKKTIPKDQMKLYNKLVPIFRILDKLVFNKMGLSVIQVGRKNTL